MVSLWAFFSIPKLTCGFFEQHWPLFEQEKQSVGFDFTLRVCEEVQSVALMFMIFNKTYSIAREFPMNGSFQHLLLDVCLFVWFTGVTPAEPRCVIVLNTVPFTATQTHLNTEAYRFGGCSVEVSDHILQRSLNHLGSPLTLIQQLLASDTQQRSAEQWSTDRVKFNAHVLIYTKV